MKDQNISVLFLIKTMDSYDNLPDKLITPQGQISKKFLELGITSFKEACLYVHEIDYGYNSTYDNDMILFKENKGTCTTKHAIIAGLAEELDVPIRKHVGVYKFTEEITTGAKAILEKYEIPYVPMVHCFLVYRNYRVDLTEGNDNGKKTSINNFIEVREVKPFISRKEEYLWFKKVLKEKILPTEEMDSIGEKTLLKAREEGIKLLKQCVK
ncbi:MAG: hypothetical protein EU548_06025 [Promethearchaeota archaeon]|nr:MAG: hypothetical protein EU548_06025 [Candidatus Lokiarchaeota archaeon]